jgi:hypothetical protein
VAVRHRLFPSPVSRNHALLWEVLGQNGHPPAALSRARGWMPSLTGLPPGVEAQGERQRRIFLVTVAARRQQDHGRQSRRRGGRQESEINTLSMGGSTITSTTCSRCFQIGRLLDHPATQEPDLYRFRPTPFARLAHQRHRPRRHDYRQAVSPLGRSIGTLRCRRALSPVYLVHLYPFARWSRTVACRPWRLQLYSPV